MKEPRLPGLYVSERSSAVARVATTRVSAGRRMAQGAVCSMLMGAFSFAVACDDGSSPSPPSGSDMNPSSGGQPQKPGPSGGTSMGGEGGDPSVEPPEGQPVLGALGSELGAGCSVKNDCAEGYSCIRGVCQPARFDIEPTGKECFVTDCSEAADCCGRLPTEVPDKCRRRAAACSVTLPGCNAGECTRSSDCAGGGTCVGRCAVSLGQCTAGADCLANRCVDGTCLLDFAACSTDAECATNTCVGGSCDCSNPSYEPADPICEDEDCEGICPYVCEASRCVLPSSCQSDDECFGSTPLCVDGRCSECQSGTDCSFEKVCIAGRCETPCKNDGNCPLFEACQAGECIYVGCRSHRECSLLPSVEAAGLPAGTDPRLLRCHTQGGIGRCIVPCQTDVQCPAAEVCSGGVCEYIGCEFDAECKTIVGLHDQQSSEEAPWVSSIECRAPDAE